MTTRRNSRFPPGWDEKRVRRVLEHYESQSEEEAVAEDETAFERASGTLMEVPSPLVPEVQQMISRYQREQKAS
jgi:hypothetical protein